MRSQAAPSPGCPDRGTVPLDRLRDTYIGSICGIAAPESFEEGLQKLGARIELSKRYTDHHRYTEAELNSFINRCVRRDLEMIVTTEKDAVRFPRLAKTDVPIYFLRVEIEILSGHESWEHCVARICKPQPLLSPERFFPDCHPALAMILILIPGSGAIEGSDQDQVGAGGSQSLSSCYESTALTSAARKHRRKIGTLISRLALPILPRGPGWFFIMLREKKDVAASSWIRSFPLGAFIVAFHNVWHGIPMIVTIMGWGLVIKSTLYFVYPRHGIRMLGTVSLDRTWHFVVAGAFSVVLSAVIFYPLM